MLDICLAFYCVSYMIGGGCSHSLPLGGNGLLLSSHHKSEETEVQRLKMISAMTDQGVVEQDKDVADLTIPAMRSFTLCYTAWSKMVSFTTKLREKNCTPMAI